MGPTCVCSKSSARRPREEPGRNTTVRRLQLHFSVEGQADGNAGTCSRRTPEEDKQLQEIQCHVFIQAEPVEQIRLDAGAE